MSALIGKWSGEGVELEFTNDGVVKATVLGRTEVYNYRFLDARTIEIDIPRIPKNEQIYEIEVTGEGLILSQSGIHRLYKRIM